MAGFVDGEHQKSEGRNQERRAGEIKRCGAGRCFAEASFGSRQQQEAEHGTRQPDRKIDPEHPAPAECCYQKPAKTGPGAQTWPTRRV